MNKYDEIVKRYADEKLTIMQFNELKENELVAHVENRGNSSRFTGYTLYNVILTNSDEISVYLKVNC